MGKHEVTAEDQAKAVDDALKELEAEGYEDFDDYDDDDYEYGEDFDYYEGMGNENTPDDVNTLDDEIKELEELGAELDTVDGFGNMFNMNLSKNCMMIIVILLILILCKEDIMKIDFFKKLFK